MNLKSSKLKNLPIFYICNDPERALGLEKLIPNFHIVCIDNSPMLDAMLAKGVKVFSLIREYPEYAELFRNSNKLLTNKLVQEYIKQNTPEGVQPNVIVFKVAPNIEQSCKKLGYKLLNTSALLNHKFEEKLSQYETLKEAELNFPATLLAALEELSFENLNNSFGLPFVIQFNRGHTGLGTVFIKNESEFNQLVTKFPKRKVRVSKFIEGEAPLRNNSQDTHNSSNSQKLVESSGAWTINACVTRYGIAYGGLCYQITGVEGITDQKGGTVGNDWSLTDRLSKKSVTQIETIVRNAGHSMQKEGYKGLFGMDLIIAPDGEVFTIEINARQPASTGMHTKLMLKQNLIPLQLLHIAEFLFENESEYQAFIKELTNKTVNTELLEAQNKEAIKKIEASQVIVRQLRENSLDFNEKPQGLYQNAQFVKPAYCIDELTKSNEQLLLKQPEPAKVSVGNEIARVQALTSHESILHFLKMPSDITIKTLPDFIIAKIREYQKLNIGNTQVTVPYLRNIERIRGELRVLTGKGSPEELETEVKIFSKLRGYPLENRTPEELREFMMQQGLGLDCSGFINHIFDYWLRHERKGRLWKYIKVKHHDIFTRLGYPLKYISLISADQFSNLNNCENIALNEIQPGDVIRLKGAKRGEHIALISEVHYAKSGLPVSFKYLHSTPHYDNQNGLKEGIVEIIDLNGELKTQRWLEIDANGKNWTYEGLLVDYEDNGLRRPKFMKLLQ